MVDISRRRLFALLGGATVGFAGHEALDGREYPAGDVGTTRLVRTTAELEAAFEYLSPGDTIRIAAENAPYRTTRWLDVDVDGATVLGPGIDQLVKPADGANVGGIRIGHGGRCTNVRVAGVGFHGNAANQNDEAKWRHGIVVKDAENVVLKRNYVTRTHPYHEHGSGGSGISVERGARHVQVLHNRVHEAGDRGIQLAGDGIVVAGNVLTDGLDRSISCDLWRDGKNYQASNVIVANNLMGDNEEGSLTGIGGGHPVRSGQGYVVIANNVGFGRHKSFCHLGFDGRVRSVQVEGNLSVQEGSATFAGVSIEMDGTSNVTVTDNDLYGYGGRGVNVERGTSEFAITGNRLHEPGQRGVRVAGGTDGVVRNNHVTRPGRAGIELTSGARHVVVENNRVRDAGGVGIVTRGATTNHVIANNVVNGYGRGTVDSPGVLVASDGNVVRANHVFHDGGPAIDENGSGRDNTYVGNWSDGAAPWAITSASSTVESHAPSFDVHRGVTADGDRSVAVAFEKPYRDRPKLEFGRVGGGIRDVSYRTDAGGNYVGATLSVGRAGGVVDVSVSPM